MLFVQYPKCTTCQKAKAWLDAQNVSYTSRNVKEEQPTLDELTQWFNASGLPIKKFVNTSGLLYRSMGLKDKLPTMSDSQILELLSTDGMLVKRPILVGEGFVLVGFKEEAWRAALEGSTQK